MKEEHGGKGVALFFFLCVFSVLKEFSRSEHRGGTRKKRKFCCNGKNSMILITPNADLKQR